MAIHSHTTIDVGELPLDPHVDTAITPDGDVHLTLRYREHSVSIHGHASEVANVLGKLHRKAQEAQRSSERRLASAARARSLCGPSTQRTVDGVLR